MQGEREVEVLQLTYFGVRGSCDKVRLLMALAGLEYREITVQGKGVINFLSPSALSPSFYLLTPQARQTLQA
jgi:hypothetical protein